MLWNELRLSARVLARSRGFAAAVIVTLGVAIALQTSALAVVNAYVGRSLPYPEAQRLYNVFYAQRSQNPPAGLESLDWTSLADVVEHPVAWDLDMFYMLGGEYTESVQGAWVTSGFVRGLGIRAAIGRTFSLADFDAGQPQVALISHELWRGRFGGDSAVVGRGFTAYVSDRPEDPETFTIVGVLPPDFWHLNPYTQVLTPLRATTYPYIVRLRANVPPAVVERRIETMVKDAGLPVPGSWRVELRPTHAEYTRAARPILLAVGAAVSLVFLIACANVALLTVLRGIRRRRELAVRIALGAGVARMARMLLAESLLLVAAAATLGVALASLVLRAFGPAIELQLGRRVPGGVSALTIDWTVVTIIGGSLLVVAVALAFTPLLGTGSIFSALRERRGNDGGRRRTLSVLIAAEVAGSLALLAGCGLMVRTVVRLLDVDLGMRAQHVISAPLAVREHSYPDAERRVVLYERLIAALRQAEGVGSVALSNPSPLASYQPRPIQADGAGADESAIRAPVRAVAGSYFDVLGIPLLRGRAFAEADRGASEQVAIVSESASRRFWPGANALGRSIRLVERQLPSGDTVLVTRTIVGVVGDVRQSPADEELADVYVPMLQTPGRFAAAVIQTRGGSPSRLGVLRLTVRGVDPEIAVGSVQEMDVAVAQQLARPRFLAALFSAFGVFAATLGVMGLYAVIAYAVKQREHEIAVRMAVGAEPRQIVGLFVRDGAYVVFAGVALGVVAAIGVGRLLQSQLFGVRPADAVTLAVASLILASAAMTAIWWPSLRASRTDPVIALKAE